MRESNRREPICLNRSCVAVPVRPGAVLIGTVGQLWMVMEPADVRKMSTDVVVAAGDRVRIDAPATLYVTDLRREGPACFMIDRSGESGGRLAAARDRVRSWLRPRALSAA